MSTVSTSLADAVDAVNATIRNKPGAILSFYTGNVISPWNDVVEYASLLAGRQLTEEDMRNRKLITGLRDDCMRHGDYRRALGEIFYPR